MLFLAPRFADHLTAILQHSLSLVSGQGETMMDLFARGESQTIASPSLPEADPDSPRSSISATSPTGIFGQHFPHANAETHPGLQRVQRMPSIPYIASSARRLQLIELMQEWSFNALELEADDLWECASLMFECVLQMEGVEVGVSIGQSKVIIEWIFADPDLFSRSNPFSPLGSQIGLSRSEWIPQLCSCNRCATSDLLLSGSPWRCSSSQHTLSVGCAQRQEMVKTDPRDGTWRIRQNHAPNGRLCFDDCRHRS